VELDPKFAYAYAVVGAVSKNTRAENSAMEYCRKAYELRDRTNARERFYIEAAYFTYVTGDEEKAAKSTPNLAELIPRITPPGTT